MLNRIQAYRAWHGCWEKFWGNKVIFEYKSYHCIYSFFISGRKQQELLSICKISNKFSHQTVSEYYFRQQLSAELFNYLFRHTMTCWADSWCTPPYTYWSGSSCSKLPISLVNKMLNFQTYYIQKHWHFCKKCKDQKAPIFIRSWFLCTRRFKEYMYLTNDFVKLAILWRNVSSQSTSFTSCLLP